MNLFSVVGQVEEMPVLKETNSGLKTTNLKLKVFRPFTNAEGEFEADIINIEIWRGIAEMICNVAKVGAWISVKGRVASKVVDKEDRTYYFYNFIAENVEFIQSDKIQ